MAKKIAFTLAETLIVMGIIGVVAALTIPNLNSSTADKEKVAKVKKIYQNLDDALGRAQAVYGPIDEWTLNITNTTSKNQRIGERITEFMKISKNCSTNNQYDCFRDANIYWANGTSTGQMLSRTGYRFITADGTSVAIDSSGFIHVDIDGPNKGNNKWGTDIFRFLISNNTVQPTRDSNFTWYLTDLTSNGQPASGWVIDYDNMDYLKIKNGKCPNGSTPTETNPRCK